MALMVSMNLAFVLDCDVLVLVTGTVLLVVVAAIVVV